MHDLDVGKIRVAALAQARADAIAAGDAEIALGDRGAEIEPRIVEGLAADVTDHGPGVLDPVRRAAARRQATGEQRREQEGPTAHPAHSRITTRVPTPRKDFNSCTWALRKAMQPSVQSRLSWMRTLSGVSSPMP